MKRVVAFSAIAGVSLILCFSTPPVAQAAQENSRCAISTDAELGATACCVVYNYNVSGSDTRLPFPGVNMLTNGPGPNTSTFTRSINSTVNYQVVVGAESEVGAVLAKAKVSISASIGGSNSTSVTNSVTLVAPSGKYAHAQYVSYGKRVSWSKTRVNSNCTTSTISSGVINFPTSNEGWYTWVSSSPNS